MPSRNKTPLMVDLLGLEQVKKDYYHSKRFIPAGKKIVLAPIEKSINAAETLQAQLPRLSFTDFPNLDEDDDSDLLLSLKDNLADFLFSAKLLREKERKHKNKLTAASINQRADNLLVDMLANLCDGPTCTKGPPFSGRYVEFLALTFPYLGISCNEIQNYARRFYDLRQKGGLIFTKKD
ncbi:MAG: hypothetical protein AB2785_09680 [Candidatus Thiodiazotropha endolucinida]